ncbi:MAG: hypothetical protein GTN78_18230 [Gemmatimonadales bacterium]|nr:hypothetical protein [Gemmatimonadales bacterium]
MGTFLGGFLLGMVVGVVLLIGLGRLCQIPCMQRQLLRLRQWASHMFWRAVQKLADYLDELVARRREREADGLGSPNLAGPRDQDVVSYPSVPPVR